MVITKSPNELTAEEWLAIKTTHECASASLDKLVEMWAQRLAGEPVDLVAATLAAYLHKRMENETAKTVGITIFAAALLRLAQLRASHNSTVSFSA